MAELSPIDSLPHQIVIRVAELFGIEAESVTPVGGGFSGASVFRVESPDGRTFALRKTPVAAALPQTRLLALHRLLRAVNRLGVSIVPVPMEPVRRRLISPGESEVFKAEESWLKSASDLWQAEPWMPGTAADESLTGDQLQSALQCLNSFYESASRATSAIGPNDWFFLKSDCSPGLLRRLAIAKELSAGFLETLKTGAAGDPDPQFRKLAIRICDSLSSWLPWLVTRLTKVSCQHFALQPVLRDVWRAHVLFTADQVTGLVDLSAAGTDDVCLDLSRLFRSWFGSDVRRIRNACEQFSQLRALDQNEWTLLEALDASTVLLSPITWLRRRISSDDRSPCRDDVLARLTELTQIAEHFQPLLG